MKIPVPLSFNRGINLFNRPRDLGDDELVRTKNLYPVTPGRLGMRPSLIPVGILNYSSGQSHPILAQFMPVDSPAVFLVLTRSVEWAVATQALAFGSVANTSSSIANTDFGGVTRGIPACMPYRGSVYLFGGPGSTGVGKILQANAALAAGVEFVDFTFSTAGNTDLRPAVVGEFRDRFVYGHLGPGYESAMVWADPFLPRAIPDNALTSDFFLLNPNDGDHITAFVEIMQTGASEAKSTLLVLKEHSAYLISGEPLFSDGSGADTYVNNRMPIDCGCVGQQTVCRTPYGIIWTGVDDVWFFPEGQLPYRIGTKIRPALSDSTPGSRHRWHAVYHDGFYKLAVHSPGGAGPDDTCTDQYWLDLRSGAPRSWQEAQWWGPEIFKLGPTRSTPDVVSGIAALTPCMALDIRPGQERSLFTVVEVGATQLYLLEMTGSSSIDFIGGGIADPLVFQWTVDNILEIDTELVTKDYAMLMSGNQVAADPIVEKGLHGGELALIANTNGVLTWSWIVNAGEEVGDDQDAVLAPNGFAMDVDVVGVDAASPPLADPHIELALDPAPERPCGRSLQMVISNKPGYYIDSTNDDLTINFNIGGIFTLATAAVPHGYYSDIETLCAAIQTAMNLALAGTGASVVINIPATHVAIVVTGAITMVFGSGLGLVDGTKILAPLLGFDTWNPGPYTGTTITATAEVPYKIGPRVEYDGGVWWMYRFGRRTI